MKSLISDKINQELNSLIGKSNDINRLIDRHISLMQSKFMMKELASILHPHYAHYFSLKLSDSIGEYQETKFALTIYPGTPDDVGNRDYENPLLMFEDELKEIIELNDMINNTIDLAQEESDYGTVSFLLDVQKHFNHILYLSQYLYNICAMNASNNDYLQLDDDISRQIKVIFKFDEDEEDDD